ncbi:MoaD/ThiS family protein [Brassicibacter mesophilus]|uniref:MoaD/ThiS family protein n=1 Tax=Brassicibacter mesophilus TaxID=745119 RepID=UPI003D1A123D
MKVEVRLFAYFREGRDKKQLLDLKESATIREVLNIIEIKEDEVSILLLNGRDGSADRELKDGDILALFPPVGGG